MIARMYIHSAKNKREMPKFSQATAELIVDYIGEAPWVPKPNLRWNRISISTQISREQYINSLCNLRWSKDGFATSSPRTCEDDWSDLFEEMHITGLSGIKSHYNWIEGVSCTHV